MQSPHMTISAAVLIVRKEKQSAQCTMVIALPCLIQTAEHFPSRANNREENYQLS